MQFLFIFPLLNRFRSFWSERNDLPAYPSCQQPKHDTQIQFQKTLNLVEGGDVHTLDQVLELLDRFSQPIDGDLFILDDTADLQLLDAVRQWNQLGCLNNVIRNELKL